jgi:acyl-CoA thioesterase
MKLWPAVVQNLPKRWSTNRTAHRAQGRHPTSFDEDTAVTSINGRCDLFKGYLTDKYDVGTSPNGGYTMAMAVSAAKSASELMFPLKYPDILSMSAQYFSVSKSREDCVLEVNVLGTSKSTICAEVNLRQSDQLKCKFTAILGNRLQQTGISHNDMTPPTLLPINKCISASGILRSMLGDKLNVAAEYEFLVDPQSPFALSTLQDRKVDSARMDGWTRFPDNRRLCAKGLAFMCDSLPPPAHNLAPFSDSLWVPTVDYTVQIWNECGLRPDDDATADYWYRCSFETLFVANGFIQTDGELWDSAGTTLLATSRQMARLFLPKR